MAIGLWLLFDQQLYLQSIGAAEQTDYIVGTYVVLGVGMVMTLVGFLGCCGSWKESPWMLATFFVFLVIILVGEVAVGVLIYFRAAPYEDFVRNFVETTVVKKYHSNSTAVTQSFDLLQEKVKMCSIGGNKISPCFPPNQALVYFSSTYLGETLFLCYSLSWSVAALRARCHGSGPPSTRTLTPVRSARSGFPSPALTR